MWRDQDGEFLIDPRTLSSLKLERKLQIHGSKGRGLGYSAK
jgi:hypothetical protein